MSETPLPPTDRLPSRTYVQPYVSDGGADQSPSSRISMLEDFKTLSDAPSTITLAPFTKSSIEPREEERSYYWPVNGNEKFSESTKAKFEKKDALPNQNSDQKAKIECEGEAPVPGFFDFNDEQFVAPPRRGCLTRASTSSMRHATREACLKKLAEIQHKHVKESQASKGEILSNFLIQCNRCEQSIPDAHWHCSVCDGGDYDICVKCAGKGHMCQDEHHWLIKRFFKDGRIITSTTETIAPKKLIKTEAKKDIPGAFTPDTKVEAESLPERAERTCNACIRGKL